MTTMEEQEYIQLEPQEKFVLGRPDFAGSCFGYSLRPRTKDKDGTDSPLVYMYVEDDGFWHLKVMFDAYWVDDQIAQLTKVKKELDNV